MKMKLLFISALYFLFLDTNAQPVLEHIYPGTSSIVYSGNSSQLYLINLEVDGEKYVHIDRINKVLNFYHLNHSFWKSIPYSNAIDVNPNANLQGILYISQHLFDLDDDIEFLYWDANGTTVVTQIVNEDGSIIFTANNCHPWVLYLPPLEQLPIYNTAAGTKLILSSTDSSTKVYALPGILSTTIIPNITESVSPILVYPNPSSETIYLNNNDFTINKIIINDGDGKFIKNIENLKENPLEINISSLSNGLYFISTYNKWDKLIETKKIVKQ